MSTTPSTSAPTSIYLAGNFGPVSNEVTDTDLTVTGTLPPELDGRYVRNGPNPVAPTEPYHWFTGNGMVHGLRMAGGRAQWFRNRWVRDDTVTTFKGWPTTPGPRHGMGPGVANTNVIGHAGRTYAIVEAGGLPVELSDELETIAMSDFDGTLDGSFSAHPKRDPATGELHTVTYYWEWDHLRYVVVGVDGKVRRTVRVPVPGRPMTHDCHITDSYVLLFDLPCQFDLDEAMAGQPFPYHWDPGYQARVGLLPREGEATEVRWVELEQCFVYHPLNAYDLDDGRVVLDACRHDKTFDQDRLSPSEGKPTLDRWLLDPATGRSSRTTLSQRMQEFPRHDERILGRRHRYGYTVGFSGSDGGVDEYGGILKHDVEGGTTESWDPGRGRSCQEAVFVPAAPDSAEDDGWLMSYTYDAADDSSSVVVLHAQDIAAGPVAEVHLPQRVPFGFHGNWIPTA